MAIKNIKKISEIDKLKKIRNDALASNTVDLIGHTFEARQKDKIGLDNEIAKGITTLWADVNDYMVIMTVSNLQNLLDTGTASVEKIHSDYKKAVLNLQD